MKTASIVFCIGLAACLLMAAPRKCEATIWTVSPGDNIQNVIEGSAPGDSIILSEGTYAQTSSLTVPKSLTIRGASGSSQPCIELSDGAYDGISVRADDVTIENLRIYRAGHSNYNSLLSVPKGGGWPNYTAEYARTTLTGCTFEGGRYGVYAAPVDLTIEECTFKDNYRDCVVLIGGTGTNTIMGNHFTGIHDSKKAILIEAASGEPPISGTLNVDSNTVNGKRNFLVFNHWNHPDTDPLELNIVHNSIYDVGSNVIVFYAAYIDDPNGFDKFGGIELRDNIISSCGGAAVYVDYEDWGGAPDPENRPVADNSKIQVFNNLTYGNVVGPDDTTDVTGNYGYFDVAGSTPTAATMGMFGLSDNLVGEVFFRDPENGDFRLLPGSVAPGGASDGTNIGAYQDAPPVANPNGPYRMLVGSDLTLDASDSFDPDGGDIVNYLWSVGALSYDAGNTAIVSLTWEQLSTELGIATNGDYTFRLTVTDDEGDTACAETQVSAVPEPTTLSLLALGGLAVVRRRRRR